MRYLFAALLLGSAIPAQAAVLTFNGEGDQYGTPVTSGGFDFAFDAQGWGLVNGDFASTPGQNVTNGTSRIMLSGGNPGRVTMTKQGGGTFSLAGLDIATAFLRKQGGMTITGTFANATTVSQSFNIGPSYQTVALNGFANVVSVTFAESTNVGFQDYGIGIDNLFVDQAMVPEPATWAMMIAGFGLACVAMRRRHAAVSLA
jgi:hypothetical protein